MGHREGHGGNPSNSAAEVCTSQGLHRELCSNGGVPKGVHAGWLTSTHWAGPQWPWDLVISRNHACIGNRAISHFTTHG